MSAAEERSLPRLEGFMEPTSDDSLVPAKLRDLAPPPKGPSAIARGAIADRRELAMLSRDYFTDHLDNFIGYIFDPAQVQVRGRLRLQFETLQWLAQRGWGKVPLEIRLDTEDDSLEGIMRRIASERVANSITTEVVPTDAITDTPSEEVHEDG